MNTFRYALSACLWLLLSCPHGLWAGSEATAVVVGISDFSDPLIADLRFADRDAEAFAVYLSDTEGANLVSRQVRLLLNEGATIASIQAALSWQLANTPTGETAYLYLATHGDVEADDPGAPGYLLAYDTPFNNYSTLALGVDYLNGHLAALAAKGAQVVLITDACHAGSLAGNAVAGRELTAARLKRTAASEVRMLSCQPYEYSYESERWGEGRGVFSYHLVRGLQGAADGNADRRVDLFELERYVQDRVATDTDREQHPEVVGGRKDRHFFGAAPIANRGVQREYLEERSADTEASFAQTQLALASAEARADYVRFQRALRAGALSGDTTGTAVFYYKRLLSDPSLRLLRGSLDEALTVALLDSVQQAIQDYLTADGEELMRRERLDEKYTVFPSYLAQAASILGAVDPRYPTIEAKRYYFEGLVRRLRATGSPQRDSLLTAARDDLARAIQLAPDAPYMRNELGIIHELRGEDSLARVAYERAQELAPTWALPYNNLSNLLLNYGTEDDYPAIEAGYRRAIDLRPDLCVAYMNLGTLYRQRGEPDSVLMYMERAVAISPRLLEAQFGLANALLNDPQRLEEAAKYYREVLLRRPLHAEARYGRGYALESLGQLDSAMAHYRHVTTLPDTAVNGLAYRGMARIYRELDRQAGLAYFRTLRDERPDLPFGYVYAAEMDTTDRKWSRPLLRLNLAEDEHYALLQNVAVEFYGFGDNPRMIETAELAVRKFARRTDANHILTIVYLLTENTEKAVTAARRTIAVASHNAELEDICNSVAEDPLFEPLLTEAMLLGDYRAACPEWENKLAHD